MEFEEWRSMKHRGIEYHDILISNFGNVKYADGKPVEYTRMPKDNCVYILYRPKKYTKKLRIDFGVYETFSDYDHRINYKTYKIHHKDCDLTNNNYDNLLCYTCDLSFEKVCEIIKSKFNNLKILNNFFRDYKFVDCEDEDGYIYTFNGSSIRENSKTKLSMVSKDNPYSLQNI